MFPFRCYRIAAGILIALAGTLACSAAPAFVDVFVNGAKVATH